MAENRRWSGAEGGKGLGVCEEARSEEEYKRIRKTRSKGRHMCS